jgi:hypothetical protein
MVSDTASAVAEATAQGFGSVAAANHFGGRSDSAGRLVVALRRGRQRSPGESRRKANGLTGWSLEDQSVEAALLRWSGQSGRKFKRGQPKGARAHWSLRTKGRTGGTVEAAHFGGQWKLGSQSDGSSTLR